MSSSSRRGPKDWTPSSSLEKKLKTKARDNHGYSYDVWLVFDHSDVMGWKWLLRIEGTPGHWYMSTLLEYGGYPRGKFISIDAGQGWNVINFDEVMAEAIELI